MINWIKRAVRWPWFGPKRVVLPDQTWMELVGEINKRAIILKAAQEATIAQKNVRLASIARTRDAIKDQIADAVKAKKKRSHLQAELGRLTRLEHEIEENRETAGRAV